MNVRASWLFSISLLCAFEASAQSGVAPRDLADCYLRVAIEKSTADMVYLARELCDAVFKPTPRSIAVLEGKGSRCTEWWFDARGRYESADQLCSLEPVGDLPAHWKLACQGKGSLRDRYTFVELRESAGHLQPVRTLRGFDVGPLFSSLAACIEYRADAAAPAIRPAP